MLQYDGQPWAPTTYTPPLRNGEIQLSDGPRLVTLLEKHWRTPDGKLVQYDDWQKAWFNHALERYPKDWPQPHLRHRLRFRQLVASLGRQNGKSLIGGGIALYGLMQNSPAPSVVGVATSVEQANVVYKRVKYAVDNDPALSKRLKASGTRGINWRDGRGGYLVKPALAEGIQSVPVTVGIADELHLLQPPMWDSLVNGQRAQTDALLAGITTAGDDTSTLLKRLYEQGYAAIADPDSDERFGFWLWEAPAGTTINDDAFILAANPAVACGRIDIHTVRSDAQKLPRPDQERYVGNRFIAATRGWADMSIWEATRTPNINLATVHNLVIGIDRTADWRHITIAAATKHNDAITTEIIATLRGWDRDRLKTLLDTLAAAYPHATYTMLGRRLSDIGKALRDEGRDVWILTPTEEGQATAGIWARVTTGTLRHPGEPITTYQLPRSRRTVGRDRAWTITPPTDATDGTADVDAINAIIYAAHVADIKPPTPPTQLF